MQAYQALIVWKKGNIRNDSNIIRITLHRGISNPYQMSMQQMEEGEAFAKSRKRTYCVICLELHHDHKRECLLKAEAEKNKDKVKGIKQKMEREGSRKMWYFID